MNRTERIKMVSAMEFITRNINDEDIFDSWLMCGVADGDIEYGNLTPNEEDMEYYIEDENFSQMMDLFLRCMKSACSSGGLYCDNVISGR